MADSNQKTPAKLEKPFRPKGSPLFAHASGRWCKKVKGRFHYFGAWRGPNAADHDTALGVYLDQKDELLAGRQPNQRSTALTIHEASNIFLQSKENQVNADELTQRSWDDYKASCIRMMEHFGKNRAILELRPVDFDGYRASLAKDYSPGTLGNQIQRTRVFLKFLHDNEHIDKPVKIGPQFRKPSKKIMRREKLKKGDQSFEARHLRQILKAADPQMKAMVYLGINAGMGNNDCGLLPFDALDLKGGWLNYPRPKTHIPRRCPLWPETVRAINKYLEVRPTPKDESSEQVFVTKYGLSWGKQSRANPISAEFRKLIRSLGLYRAGQGFYCLRRTFATIADGSTDAVAVSAIMGHAEGDSTMQAVYRQRIDDSRLETVSNTVRRWLFRRDSNSLWREGRSTKTNA